MSSKGSDLARQAARSPALDADERGDGDGTSETLDPPEHGAVFSGQMIDLAEDDCPEVAALHAESRPGEFDFTEHFDEGEIDEDEIDDEVRDDEFGSALDELSGDSSRDSSRDD